MNKVLTISVAAYNAENDLRRCLDSMLKTTIAEKLEIIIVNDGSKDNTLSIAKEYETKFPSIVRVIDKNNGGHGSTINASIRVATGKYYKIVDSDDWVVKDGIEKLVHELEKINVDLILNPYQDIEAETFKQNCIVKPYSDNAKIGVVQSINCIDNIVIYMHSTTFKTEIVKQMGPIIDENCFYVDMEYTLFPLKYVQNYICFDFPVYQYLLGTATQSMNKNILIKRREQHLKVTKRIIEYYEEIKTNSEVGIQKIVLRRVRLALLNQYKIYFNMSSSESRIEIKGFDKWTKETSSETYEGPEGKLMKIVKFNRQTDFIFYSLINKLMKVLKLEPVL